MPAPPAPSATGQTTLVSPFFSVLCPLFSMKIFMPLGDATEAMDTFYPYYRLQEDGYDVVIAGPEARLYHTVLHEIPPDSNVPWDITQERPGYFIRSTAAFRDLKADDYAGMFISGGRAPEYLRYDKD